MKKVFLATCFFVFVLFFLPEVVKASEGVIEITSLTDEPYRCWAASVRMQNQEYKIPFTCRNLIYPASGDVFNYIMWATPKDGGAAIKLGTLGLGRGLFTSKKAFTNLFVTTEKSKDVKAPAGKVVMRGNVEPIEPFFQKGPTITPEAEKKEVSKEEVKPQELTTKQKFLLALRRAGLAALIALVALIGLIFVVTRSRG